MNKRLRVAIYMRLSKEDSLSLKESNSIRSQRFMLTDYVRTHLGEYEVMEFVDDGYSGINFERPGIKRLLEQVEKSQIDCIVVKDFSRFSRDYIEMGSYLEQIFPCIGLRFISINDGYDSENDKGNVAGIEVSFKNLLYDLYSKDLSVKIKASLKLKNGQGEFTGSQCAFGYQRNPENRHQLIVKKDEAMLVKRIFEMALSGMTSTQIAKQLNQEKVQTPMQLKIGASRNKAYEFLWSSSMICHLLSNRVYIGDMVYEKTYRQNWGEKKQLKPRADWKIYRNHHEAIISEACFEALSKKKKTQSRKVSSKKHPLIGKMICGGCFKSMRYRESLNPYFSCQHRYYNGIKECVVKINAMFAEQYILYRLQDQISLDEMRNELTEDLVKDRVKKVIIYDELHMEVEWQPRED